jgi:hypothetical protein
MNDLSQTSLFSSHHDVYEEICIKIKSSKMIHLMASADLESIIALSQLEAALLDCGLAYRRRVLPSLRHTPRDEVTKLPETEGMVIYIDSFSDSVQALNSNELNIQILPIAIEMKFDDSDNSHHGAIDCVATCGVLAAMLAPQGARVRKQRSMIIGGSWLRQSLEVNYAPVMAIIRDHLDEEGSLDIRPLPEVPSPAQGMIPGLSDRMLKRLVKSWPKMDIDQRSSAISELVLPALREDGLSTGRLEELVWHRALIPGNDVDIASQLHSARQAWPDDSDAARIHSSKIADQLITTGCL